MDPFLKSFLSKRPSSVKMSFSPSFSNVDLLVHWQMTFIFLTRKKTATVLKNVPFCRDNLLSVVKNIREVGFFSKIVGPCKLQLRVSQFHNFLFRCILIQKVQKLVSKIKRLIRRGGATMWQTSVPFFSPLLSTD